MAISTGTKVQQGQARKVDADGALSVDELQSFARVCNDGEAFSEEELGDLRFFHQNDRGHLTLKGFLQMMHTQTVARPSDTWQDLKALGFDKSLGSGKSGCAAAKTKVAAASPPAATCTNSSVPPTTIAR